MRARGYGVIAFEITRGEQYDLSRRCVVQLIEGWLKSYVVMGVMFATPCGTWSRARRNRIELPGSGRPLRTRRHIFGLPDLTLDEIRKVAMGNATARATCRLIEFADGLNLPVILENPVNSMLWIVPRLVKLRSRPSCQVVLLDQCRWGTRWRKRTRVAAWNCQGIDHLNLLCTGRNGICSRSKRHHIVLTGRAPCGVPWTRLAQVYPKPLANRLGDVLINSNEQLIGANFRNLV